MWQDNSASSWTLRYARWFWKRLCKFQQETFRELNIGTNTNANMVTNDIENSKEWNERALDDRNENEKSLMKESPGSVWIRTLIRVEKISLENFTWEHDIVKRPICQSSQMLHHFFQYGLNTGLQTMLEMPPFHKWVARYDRLPWLCTERKRKSKLPIIFQGSLMARNNDY